MRILFFINRIANKGGSERVAVFLANKLAEMGNEVQMLTWMGGNKSFYTLHPDISVKALFDGDVNIYSAYIKTLIKYKKEVQAFNPDQIIDVCTALSLVSVPMKAILSVNLISWEHFNTRMNWNVFTPRLARWLASKFANTVVALTASDRDNFTQFYGAKNAVAIPNPLTLTVTAKPNLAAKVVLSIGRITHQKGFDLLLQSWKIVLTKHPDWHLHIVGDGDNKEALLFDIEKLQLSHSVKLFEPTLLVNKFYENASIFALSSRFEGLPLVLIEAKAFGLPIVSFDCETGPRDIVNHEIDGILVEPENVQLFAEAVIFLIENPEIRTSYSAAAKLDLDRFDLDHIVAKWQSIFKSP